MYWVVNASREPNFGAKLQARLANIPKDQVSIADRHEFDAVMLETLRALRAWEAVRAIRARHIP